MKRVPVLKTDRLIFRGIAENDTQKIVDLRSNPDVYRYFVAPHKITPQEHITWYKNNYLLNENRIDWMAFDASENFVGIFGVKRDNQDSAEAEVSYILTPAHYKKGYASEAVERLIQFCWEEWDCDSITAEIHEKNKDSIYFAEKLGFKLERKEGLFLHFKRKA